MVEAELLAGEREALLAGDPSALHRLLQEPGVPTAVVELAELLETTLVSPLASFTLRLRTGGREQCFDGRLGPLLAMTLDGGGEAPAHLVLGAMDELPRVVAELVEVGPRPLKASWADIAMPYEPLDHFAGFGCGTEALEALHETFAGDVPPDVLSALFDGAALRWTLTLRTDEDDDAAHAGLDVIDARERGLWLIDEGPQPGSVWVRPMTSSALWVLLSGLVSTKAEAPA